MSAKKYIPQSELYAEERRKREEEERKKYALDHTVVLFTPLSVEPSDLGGYYPCIPTPDRNSFENYWGIFPKPVGFVKILPDGITERQFKRVMIGERPKETTPWLPSSEGARPEWGYGSGRIASERQRHREKEEQLMKEWDSKDSRRINYEYKDFVNFKTKEGRKFTSDELEEILRNNDIVTKRSSRSTLSKEFELDAGLNPVGVRNFFETQFFSNPPGVEFTPALLKPYMLSPIRVRDIDPNPRYLTRLVQVPVALYSGLYYGDTCCGQVFDKMLTADEIKAYGYDFAHTFKDDEERNAFFLQICKMVIAGIEKDGDPSQDCANHGNYGNCIVDFFNVDSDYYCYKICGNNFLRDRVIMLLFHKVIEANEKMREIIEFQKMKSVMVEHALDPGVYKDYKGHDRPAPPRKRNEQAVMESILKPTIHTGKSESHDSQKGHYEALLNRYFDIIIEIMKNTTDITRGMSGITRYPNPLNIELCSAETELVPSAPDSEGRVRYVAKFVKPRNPDGRTMAHLLAERCPRVLMRLMVDPQIRGVFVLKYNDKDNEKYQTSTGVYVEHSKRFIPNPIAYSIPDVNGDTPRSLAIAKLTEAVATARFRDLHLVESRALEFFSSLPEPQPDRVFVEREQFIKRHMGSSKLRSAVGKLSVPEVSSGLRNMFKSDRAFKEASDMQGNLTGRQLSMITGKTPSHYSPTARNREGPANLIKSKDYVVDRDMRGFGGGKYTRKQNMNRRYGDTHKRQSRCVRRILGGRKRKNGRSGRSGRIRKNTARIYRK
jgi:hypothetical protein